MKVALVAIGRMENEYAQEWVSHHLALGFDHIYIYDNNHTGEERFEEVLSKEIAKGSVTIVNYRNRENAQRMAYNDAYSRYGAKYDWLAYFDFDEFLCLPCVETQGTVAASGTVDTWLATIPSTEQVVMVPWMMMTDSGLIRNDHRPLMERFTEHTESAPQQGKCIVRTKIAGLRFTRSVHVPYEPVLRCCTPKGMPTIQKRHQPLDKTAAYLKHFSTKTIEEWMTNKWRKGAAGVPYEVFKEKYQDYFFSINERTPEKDQYIINFKQQNMTENMALCAIGRRENQYAKEWVEHYRKLGLAHIYIYDNNHDGEERFEEVLSEAIAEGFVTIIDWRNRENAQLEAYNDCYKRFSARHDWMAFFDFDEFLCLPDVKASGTVAADGETVGNKGAQCILINWMNMTDSGLVRNDHRPLMERFTEPMPLDKTGIGGDFPENNHVKCIVKCGIEGLAFLRNPHVPTTPALRCYNAKGEPVKQKPRIPYTHEGMYLKHFTTKTIEEWLENKMQKGVGAMTMEQATDAYKDYFFKINERTAEKEAFIKEWYQQHGHVAAVALGRLGNQMFIACAARKYAHETGRKYVGLVYNDHSKKPREWDYPQEQFTSVMRNEQYMEPTDVTNYYRMAQGAYVSNGLPPQVTQRDVLLNDYFQDARCIDRQEALKLFAPQRKVLTKIKQLYGDVSNCVCVNVRRGDYIEHQRFGFRVLTVDEINDMLDLYFDKNRYPRVLFVSDDIAWCRENFKGEQYIFADKHKDGESEVWPPLIDLYLQTLCRGNIIANSSFSWWGAYLNKKAERVVCPWPWFTSPKKPAMTHLLPEEWLKYNPNDYTIWQTYHNDALLTEYNLKEDAHHRLFAVHHDAPLENINYLNPCWSELTTMWYVWKNKIVSPLVGFAHYRRPLNPVALPDKHSCLIYKRLKLRDGETVRDQYARCHNVKDFDLMVSLINRRYGEGNPHVEHLLHSTRMIINCCFLMHWQNFMALGDFLFPLLDDFAEATGCGREVERWREKARQDFPDADEQIVSYQMRLPGFLAERMISAWITTTLNVER